MCVTPSTLANGITVPCRLCWQCRANRVNDWCGRNVAEKTTSVVSYAVTLTYGRAKDGVANHLRSVLLTYSDIQKMLKRMRFAGYNVRYMMTGEYGSTYRRAHWHGVFHFTGDKLPEWDGAHLEWSQERWDRVGGIHIPEWEENGSPLGFVHIKQCEYAHMRYALKYMLKDQFDQRQQLKFGMSKYPPLGNEYITTLARETAENRAPIKDLYYRFPVTKWNGEKIVQKFYLQGKSAENYITTYIDTWHRLYGPKSEWPTSEVVDTYYQFGRLGKEENLTETSRIEWEAQARYDKMENETMAAPASLQEYWKRQDKERRNKARAKSEDDLAALGNLTWDMEQYYYGKEWQRERPGRTEIDLNSYGTLARILAGTGYTEQQFWALPWEQLERIWQQFYTGPKPLR